MQGCARDKSTKTIRTVRYGAPADRRAARLLRAAGIGVLAVILAMLIATLPPVDSGGGLVATAFADDDGSGDRGDMGGVRRGSLAGEEDDDLGADDDDQGADDDDQGENGGRGGAGYAGAGRDMGGGIGYGGGHGSGKGRGGGRGTGNGGGNGNGGGTGNGGYGDGQSDDGDSDITGGHGNTGGRGDEDRRDRGGDRDTGAAARDFTAESLEDRAPAAGAAAALEALRATVLSADEEAAAIAAGWTPAD